MVEFPQRCILHPLQIEKVDNILTKDTEMRVNLNIDDDPIDSLLHTHPSHPQTSRLLCTSLSLVAVV